MSETNNVELIWEIPLHRDVWFLQIPVKNVKGYLCLKFVVLRQFFINLGQKSQIWNILDRLLQGISSILFINQLGFEAKNLLIIFYKFFSVTNISMMILKDLVLIDFQLIWRGRGEEHEYLQENMNLSNQMMKVTKRMSFRYLNGI